MGRPLRLLLPYSSDWRWLLDRKDTLWCPTARLFRQPSIGDWDSVIEKVKAESGANPGKASRVKPAASAGQSTLCMDRYTAGSSARKSES
jgi:hypothetical protein